MWKVKAALCLLAPLGAHATTLVALWTPGRILIGADSRVVAGRAGDGAAEACKIGHVGSTWFAFAGLVGDGSIGYTLGDVVRQSLSTPGELRGKTEQFIGTVQPLLSRAAAALRREDESEFARFSGGKPLLQAMLADTLDGRPALVTISFALDAAGAVQPRVSLIDGSDLSGPRILYAGQQDRIREYLRSHHDWISGDNVSLVRDLVQLEVDANTPWVGGPVDVVEISSSGPRWVQSKSACRE